MIPFTPFPPAMAIDAPEFVAYKERIGVQKLTLKSPETTSRVIEDIETAVRNIAGPFKDHLHAPGEFRALYEIVLGLNDTIPQPEGHIVNCGTFRGANTCVIASALRDGHCDAPVITLDPFTYAHVKTNADDTTDLVFLHHKRLIEALQLQKYIVSVFHTNLEYLHHFWTLPIRIAVIDTCHRYEQTVAELQSLTKYIPPGGWFISHDYMPAFSSVVQALHEFLATTPRKYKLFSYWAYLFIQFLD